MSLLVVCEQIVKSGKYVDFLFSCFVASTLSLFSTVARSLISHQMNLRFPIGEETGKKKS